MKILAITVALVAILGSTACSSVSSTEATAPQSGPEGSRPPQVSVSPTRSAPKMTLSEALSAAGADCQPAASGQTCTLNGVTFTMSMNGWDSGKPMRNKACADGYVNPNYTVITDGSDMITTDHSENHTAILRALKAQGVTAQEEKYCP